jgi:hypothetical protein
MRLLDTKSELQKQTKGKLSPLQPIDLSGLPRMPLRKNLAHQAIQQGHADGYPYKMKKYFHTKCEKYGSKSMIRKRNHFLFRKHEVCGRIVEKYIKKGRKDV